MRGGKREHFALPHILGGPGLGGVLENLRLLEIRVLVICHPLRIMKQRVVSVGIDTVNFAELRLVVEILSQSLQERRVRPLPFRVEQIQRRNVVCRMDAAANQLIRLDQEPAVPRQAMAVDQREYRMAGAPAWTVEERRHSHARQPCMRGAEPSEDCLPAVVHVDNPLGKSDRCVARQRISRQQPMQSQAGGVVVFVRRAASPHPRVAGMRPMARRAC